jgi:transposase
MAKTTPGRVSSNLDSVEISYMLGLRDARLSHAEIAEKTNRSKSAVTRALQRYDIKTFKGVAPPPGNPKKLSNREVRGMIRVVNTNRRSALSDITNLLPTKVSDRTLRRRLKDAGIQKHIAVKKPMLTEQHMQKRLEFALEYKNWTVRDWNKVVWSDESKVEIGRNSRPVWVFRSQEEKYHKDCLTTVFKSNRTSIMVWGCFATNKVGPLLTFPKGGIDSVEYIQTLKDGLLPFFEEVNGIEESEDPECIRVATVGDYIFQQDNAPIHNSHATRAFFHQYNLLVMKWPPNSPDLNPIENLWTKMKAEFHKEWEALGSKRPSQSAEAMAVCRALLKRVWKGALGDLPGNLVEPMPRRIAAVIEAKGGHSKY